MYRKVLLVFIKYNYIIIIIILILKYNLLNLSEPLIF